jgi:hypothetical protein
MSDNNTLIAGHDGFELHHGPDRGDHDGWKNFKLILTKRSVLKCVFFLGWNLEQKRLAKNRDNAILREQHPSIHRWVCDELRQHSKAEEHATDVVDADDAVDAEHVEHAAADAVPANADVDPRAKSLADAVEAANRWNEMQQAQRREAEARKARQREEADDWHRARYADFLAAHGAFGWPPPMR